MLELTALPARQGDALWIRWGDEAEPHQMIIDMGTEQIGKKVRERLLALPVSQRVIDLLVITHVDRDHIGGVLTCLAEADPIPGLVIKDIWFNGYQHLKGQNITPTAEHSSLESMGAAQGERLSSWLRRQTWNQAFDGNQIARTPGEAINKVVMHDGLSMSVVGPTPELLRDFIDKWENEVAKALKKGSLDEVSPGLESMGPKHPPELLTHDDLRILANSPETEDGSHANGSSIALLLQYKGKSLLLSGDAFHDTLIEGIESVSPDTPLKLDVFKLPHHGSKNNISKKLVESVECDLWLISSDGTQFRHPDPIAMARIIEFSKIQPASIGFNVKSKYSGWWDNTSWKNKYNYKTRYGSDDDGLTLNLVY